MKIDKSLMAGSTTILILKLLEFEDMYGYQMIEELDKRSENIFKLKAGTLYPLLHSMEQQNLVSSYTKKAEKERERKYYKITQEGRKLFEKKKSEWKLYSSVVNKVLGGEAYAVLQ